MCENNDEYFRRIFAKEYNKRKLLEQEEKREGEENHKKDEDDIPSLMVGETEIRYNPKDRTFQVISKEDQDVGINCRNKGEPFKKGTFYGCSNNNND